jgi:hypothetical protein
LIQLRQAAKAVKKSKGGFIIGKGADYIKIMPEKEKKQNTEPKKKIGDKIIDSFGVLGKFDPFQTYKFFRDDYKEFREPKKKKIKQNQKRKQNQKLTLRNLKD